MSVRLNLETRLTTVVSSERLVVSLAACLPSLSTLSLSRVSRSALHLDPCPPEATATVPLVLNDQDIPPHPLLGPRLVLPALLSLSKLRVLEIRDTWLGCDHETSFDPGHAAVEKLVLTGNMYTDPQLDIAAHMAWIRACGPTLTSLTLGVPLVPESELDPEHYSLLTQSLASPPLQSLSHVHVNASLVPPDQFVPSLATLAARMCMSGVSRITINYDDDDDDEKRMKRDTHLNSDDGEFMRQCALDDLEDWKGAVEGFLDSRQEGGWAGLRRVSVELGEHVRGLWETRAQTV